MTRKVGVITAWASSLGALLGTTPPGLAPWSARRPGHEWIYSAPGWNVRRCCRRCGEIQ